MVLCGNSSVVLLVVFVCLYFACAHPVCDAATQDIYNAIFQVIVMQSGFNVDGFDLPHSLCWIFVSTRVVTRGTCPYLDICGCLLSMLLESNLWNIWLLEALPCYHLYCIGSAHPFFFGALK